MLKLVVFTFLWTVYLVFSENIPCLIFKNSFVEITPTTFGVNETTLSIHLRSRQTNGWLGVGFSSSKNIFTDSIFVLSVIREKVFVLKNHTQVENVANKISEIDTTQPLRNIIDGVYSFNFHMNSSFLLERNFLFLALNEDSISLQNSTDIPKHTSISNAFYLDMRQNLNDYPACKYDLNIPGRILARHWSIFYVGTLLNILLCIGYVYFRNDQPLKSRFFAPLFVVISVQVNLFSEYLYGYFYYDESVKFFCFINGFMSYSSIQLAVVLPTLMIVRYSILLQLHLHKQKFINKVKKLRRRQSGKSFTRLRSTPVSIPNLNSTSDSENEKSKIENVVISKTIRYIRRLLLILQSHWVFIGAPFVWVFFFLIGQFAILSVSEFKCKPWTETYMRYHHVFFLAINAIAILISLIFDLILNLKNFFKCQWKRYYFDDDTFHYRMDMPIIVMLLPFVFLWLVIPLPYLFRGIVVDIMMFLSVGFGGGVALFITIIKKSIFLIKTQRIDNKRLKMTIEMIIKEKLLLEQFITFAESEWSSENIYFKIDISEYKKKTDQKTKMILANQIKENYLVTGISPLEVNSTRKSLNPTLKQMEDLEFSNDLFDKIEAEVDANLCDTLARFIVSSEYDYYLKLNQETLTKMGL
jgi:hypothetical protein